MEIPVGWSEQRVQEYFEWAKKVVDGIRGTNKNLELELDQLFKKHLSLICMKDNVKQWFLTVLLCCYKEKYSTKASGENRKYHLR